jgi:hypothetical protein
MKFKTKIFSYKRTKVKKIKIKRIRNKLKKYIRQIGIEKKLKTNKTFTKKLIIKNYKSKE